MSFELTNGAGAGAGAAGGSGGAAVKWFCNLLKYHSRVSAGGGAGGEDQISTNHWALFATGSNL